jgi:hypothetical protein
MGQSSFGGGSLNNASSDVIVTSLTNTGGFVLFCFAFFAHYVLSLKVKSERSAASGDAYVDMVW